MHFLLPSAAKLNLSLRVVSKRDDGYHNIVSLFLRLPSFETLAVAVAADADIVRTRGIEVEGENIVARALRLARASGFLVPFYEVEIGKNLYPGSGLGAGSGNAAAMLEWLSAEAPESPLWREVALKTGADVPFLFSGRGFARVSGIGEVVEPLSVPDLYAWVVFPSWTVGTENAYGDLDRRLGESYPKDEKGAYEESEFLMDSLVCGRKLGLLPNDFTPGLLGRFPGYADLFSLFEASGSSAWGITGSGAAAFALFAGKPPCSGPSWPGWIRRVLVVRTGNDASRRNVTGF